MALKNYSDGVWFMRVSIFLAALCVVAPAAVAANDKDKAPAPRPAIVQKLFDCSGIADPAARLACYDQNVSDLADAETSKDIIIADKETMKKTEKGLFGFTLPKIGLFGNDDENQIAEIEGKIASVRKIDLDQWSFTLEDGAKWSQIVAKDMVRQPKSGMTVRIRRASMGSFLANVDGQVAIRVKREN